MKGSLLSPLKQNLSMIRPPVSLLRLPCLCLLDDLRRICQFRRPSKAALETVHLGTVVVPLREKLSVAARAISNWASR